MNAKYSKATMMTLAKSLVLSSLTLAALTAAGCDKLTAGQIAGLTKGGPASSAVQSAVDAKPDSRSITDIPWRTNHNETFLAD